MRFSDIGVTKAGEYSLTDETYANLLSKLADEKFTQVTPELKANIVAFYLDPKPPAFAEAATSDCAPHSARWLTAPANGTPSPPTTTTASG